MIATTLRTPAQVRPARESGLARWLVRLAAARGVMPHRMGSFDFARSAVAQEALKRRR